MPNIESISIPFELITPPKQPSQSYLSQTTITPLKSPSNLFEGFQASPQSQSFSLFQSHQLSSSSQIIISPSQSSPEIFLNYQNLKVRNIRNQIKSKR